MNPYLIMMWDWCDICKEARNDPLLQRVLNYTLNGWEEIAKDEHPEILSYYRRRYEMSIYKGILLWGIRVIIPTKYRAHILEELHTGRVGIVKMKGIARRCVLAKYWQAVRKYCKMLHRLCTSSIFAPYFITPMDPTSHRFCWPVPQSDVPGDRWRTQ